MEKYLKYIPKQYRGEIRDFYKDHDGWWICLKVDSLYWFNPRGYGSDSVIHENTLKEAVREFKHYICLK